MPGSASVEAGDGETEKFYSYDYGSAHFTVLRTRPFNLPAETARASLPPEQLAFLQEDLSSTKKFWKIVVLYHSP